MAEFDYDGIYGDASFGHIIDGANVRLDLYRLQCAFEASPSMALKCIDSHGCPLRALMDDHEYQEITRLVISISTFGRMLDDRLYAMKNARINFTPSENWLGWLAQPVGTLIADISKIKDEEYEEKNEEALKLRDAFNVVLHAKKMNFDIEDGETHANNYLRPYLYFYGTHRKHHWRATIHVYDYIEKIYNLSNHLAF